VNVDRRTRTKVAKIRGQPLLSAGATYITQVSKKIQSALYLEATPRSFMNDSASIAWMSIVFISLCNAPLLTSFGEGNRSHLAHQRRIKANFVQSIQYVAGCARNCLAHNRIDVNYDNVRGLHQTIELGRCNGPQAAASLICRQKLASVSFAPSRPPIVRPYAMAVAFMAPALAAQISSKDIRPSFKEAVQNAPGECAVRTAAL